MIRVEWQWLAFIAILVKTEIPVVFFLLTYRNYLSVCLFRHTSVVSIASRKILGYLEFAICLSSGAFPLKMLEVKTFYDVLLGAESVFLWFRLVTRAVFSGLIILRSKIRYDSQNYRGAYVHMGCFFDLLLLGRLSWVF